MKIIYFCINRLRSITNWVNPGSEPPKSENIFAKIGITQTNRTDTTMMATAMMAIGYAIADFIWAFSLAFFSICFARRWRIVSNIPPASPARTILE